MQNRQKIFEHIQKYPGQTLSQIYYRLEIPQSTIKHHLVQLTVENKIVKESLFKTHYFPNNISNELKIKSCIENNNNMKNIYQNLVKEMTLEEISSICNISKSLMSKRLKILISIGAVKKIKKDKKTIFLKSKF